MTAALNWFEDWQEWQTRRLVLRPDEARALAKSHLRFGVEQVGEYYDVSTTRWVGVDTILGRQVTVRPKMETGRLLYLMARGSKVADHAGFASLDREPDIVEGLRWAFLTATTAALRTGLFRQYLEVREDLAAMRGRVDIQRQFIERFGVFPPISCEFDEFAVDNEPNRRLLAAARLLLVGARPGNVTRRIRSLVRQLGEGVSTQRYRSRVAPLTIGRELDVRMGPAAADYRTAVALAESVLANSFVRFSGGGARTIGFAVNMDNVYERFLFVAIRDALGVPRRLWNKPVLRLFDGDRETHVPDMVWWHRPGQARLVLDAKWMDRDPKSNARKMLDYCVALGLDDAVLIHGGGTERVRAVPRGRVRVHSMQLSMEGSIQELEARISELAARLEELAPARRATARGA